MHSERDFDEYQARIALGEKARIKDYRDDAPAAGQASIVMQLMILGYGLGWLRTTLQAQTTWLVSIGVSQLVLLSLILWRVW